MQNQMAVFKEIMAISRKSVYNNEATIEIPNEDKPLLVRVCLSPQSGPYKGGIFYFKMDLNGYPDRAPKITSERRVYHPNINHNGSICFSMLTSDWTRNYRVEHYVNGLLFLMQEPNLDSRLNSNVTTNREEFLANAALSLGGAKIGSTMYPPAVDMSVEVMESTGAIVSSVCGRRFVWNDLAVLHQRVSAVEIGVLQDRFPNMLDEVICWRSLRMYQASKRATVAQIPLQQVTKELMFAYRFPSTGQTWNLCLVIMNGDSVVNMPLLKKAIRAHSEENEEPEVELGRFSKHQLAQLRNAHSASIFAEQSTQNALVFVNVDVFAQERICTSLNYPRVSVIMKPGVLLAVCPRASVEVLSNSVAAPVVDLVVAPVVDPVVAPVVDPVVAPVVEPVIAPVVEPVAAPVVAPLVAPVVDPVVAPVVEPVIAPVVEPVVAPLVEPIVAPVPEPIVAPVPEPVIAPVQPLVQPPADLEPIFQQEQPVQSMQPMTVLRRRGSLFSSMSFNFERFAVTTPLMSPPPQA